MGVISPENNIEFKSSAILFSKVKRFLSSYNDANLIDEDEFNVYLKEELSNLGLGVYKEEDAVVKVKGYKAPLPDDFKMLYAAYKCTPSFNNRDYVYPQGAASVFNDVTWELLSSSKGCDFNCVYQESDSRIIEKITVRQYVETGKEAVGTFMHPVLLRLSPNVRKHKCTSDCENLLSSSELEISIEDGFIITNFDDDSVYLKYYAFPQDENGLPLVPDLKQVEKALEWYIIYQLLSQWFFNNSVPDVESRMRYAESRYNLYHAEAEHLLKLPSFITLVNQIRRQRKINKIMVFTG